MGERHSVVLADILQEKGYIRGPFGSALKRPEMKSEGIPVYEQQQAIYNTRDFRFFIDEEKLETLKRFQVQTNDLLISCSGTVGRVTIIREDDPKGIISQALLILRADTKKVLPEYLKYFFTSRQGYNAIVSRSSGSVQVNISKRNVIEQIPISLPSIYEQKMIVGILKIIDDRIAVNTQINRNLSEQAQALYKSWFIDYEPYGGVMPDDWKQGTLGDIAEIRTDAFRPDKNPGVVVEHYSIPALDEKNYPVFEEAADIKSNKYFVTKNDVMFSKLNPDTKRIWRPYCLSEYSVCSTEFMVYRAHKPEYKDFVFSIIDSVPFLQHVCAHTSGSTNSRQRAMPATTLTFDIVIPTEEVIKSFCNAVTPMYELIEKNVIENQALAETRDRLLPKLMSGELDVSDQDI